MLPTMVDLSNSKDTTLLPQYGFGATYSFDKLVEDHHFLFRVHTPKRRGVLSRPSSPSPRPASPFGSPHRPSLTRSPSSLSNSVTSIRTADSGPSDYFAFNPGHPGDEDDAAPGDPYFLSRRFKDDLTSPDPGRRRRTLSTLSTLSGGSGSYSYIGSDDGSDAEPVLGSRQGNLSRSASVIVRHSRTRSDSLSSPRPAPRRSQSVDIRIRPSAVERAGNTEESVMTYADLVRHLDWTTRSSSPYVTTSFSFFWCLWDAVRRYKLAVKHDVEIAVIDARKVRERARTALEVLRGVEKNKQDKAYWKWYRFALESQDVLVFGAIPGDAIYASIPLAQILPKLPSYFFQDDVSKPITDPREPDPALDPRSPVSQNRNPIFPTTPGRPQTPQREREDRALIAHLLSTLTWDVGTTLKPPRKSKDVSSTSSSASIPRHTSHADFCKTLSAVFTKRPEADQLRDATTSAVGLAELLIEPWFRARCAEGAAYPFRHDDSDESDNEKLGDSDKMGSVCLGLAGDGCALEHSQDSSIQDALFAADGDDETEEEAARREAAAVLSELSLYLARWPAEWWYSEHAHTVEGLIGDIVGMCVTEASRGVQGRIAWGMVLEDERERQRTLSGASSVRSRTDSLNMSGSLKSERRGREETRERSRPRSPFGSPNMKHVRHASEGLPSPKPWPSSDSPYKPRARSPLGATPALGPAIIIRPKSKPQPEASDHENVKRTETKEQEQKDEQAWSPSTPPPSPPLGFSLSEGNLRSTGPKGRKSPPPAPPPRSSRRPPSPSQSFVSSIGSLDSPSPSPKSSPASSLKSSSLLKQSVHRRAESIPGGWPGTDDKIDSDEQQKGTRKEEEGDVFWDPSQRAGAKARPLSWAGSGMALGAASAPDSYAGSRKSSMDNLRGVGQGSPSSSPSLVSRTRSRTQSDSGANETLLAEVVQSALGLTAGISSGLPSSGSPLRVDTASSSNSQQETDRPSAPTHHRRHSSHGLVHALETELSPVREVDEADAEKTSPLRSAGGLHDEHASKNAEVIDADATRLIAASELVSEPTQFETDFPPTPTETSCSAAENMTSNVSELEGVTVAFPTDLFTNSKTGATVQQASGASTPRSERRLSRSGTLASIPEEDWADWALVEAPPVSEYETDVAQQALRFGPSLQEADIPLPPSPPLAYHVLEDDGQRPRADIERPGVVEGEERGRTETGEGTGRVPEITLSVANTRSDASEVNAEQQTTAASEMSGLETQTSLTESRTFTFPLYSAIRSPLLKTQAVLRAVLALPALRLFRWTSRTNTSPVPSPVFEDTDPADTYLRLSPLFSLFRIPLLRAGLRSFRQREVRPARSLSVILAPPSSWNAPILESECEEPEPTMDSNDIYWDSRSTSWAMSCFVCGVMATLALAAVQQQRCDMYMMVGNRYH